MAACAYRLAPVQIKWVGMQNHSSGLAEMDWIITDRWETPPGWSTSIPNGRCACRTGMCATAPPPYAPDVVPLPALANGHITFGCFNNLAKVTPRVIAHLVRDPASRAGCAHGAEDPCNSRTSRPRNGCGLRFAAHGIGPERIELRGRLRASALSAANTMTSTSCWIRFPIPAA